MKTTKNPKLLRVKNSNIDLNIDEYEDYFLIEFDIDIVIEPAERPRTSVKINNMYDPLSSYKNYIKKYLLKKTNELKYKPCNGYIEIFTTINIQPNKSMSDKEILLALRNEIKPLKKPDNDNVEKTIFDTFNKILWEDDCQIIFNQTTKKFSYKNSTNVIIKIFKEKPINFGRISKKEKETMNEDEINFINKIKNKKDDNNDK